MIGNPNIPVGKFYLEEHDLSRELIETMPSMIEAAREQAVSVDVDPNLTGSCEDPDNLSTRRIYTVPTEIIYRDPRFRGIDTLYHTRILELGRLGCPDLVPALRRENRMNVNIQFGEDAAVINNKNADGYDAHADFNGQAAVLYDIEGDIEGSFEGGESYAYQMILMLSESRQY